MSAKKQADRKFRVSRAFTHGESYFSSNDNNELSALPATVLKDRIERGYLEELDAPIETAPAEPAKE